MYEVGDDALPDRESGQVTSAPVSNEGPRRAILGQLPRMYRPSKACVKPTLDEPGAAAPPTR